MFAAAKAVVGEKGEVECPIHSGGTIFLSGIFWGEMIGGGNQGLTPVVGVFETAALIFCAARDFTPIYQQIILDPIRQHFLPFSAINRVSPGIPIH